MAAAMIAPAQTASTAGVAGSSESFLGRLLIDAKARMDWNRVVATTKVHWTRRDPVEGGGLRARGLTRRTTPGGVLRVPRAESPSGGAAGAPSTWRTQRPPNKRALSLSNSA